jgi:hypothetical protein
MPRDPREFGQLKAVGREPEGSTPRCQEVDPRVRGEVAEVVSMGRSRESAGGQLRTCSPKLVRPAGSSPSFRCSEGIS